MVDLHSRSNRSSGFTLLELIIVIAILGLILAALTNGVRFAGRAWQVQERQSTRQGDFDAVQNLVRNLIASGTKFEGDSTSLRFVSELPEALARNGLYEVNFHAAGDRLVLSWSPHFKGSSNSMRDTETELARGVAGFELTYYIPPDGWRHVVNAAMKRPALVRVNLQLEGRAWPPLVVAPMIDDLPRTRN
jgi:prepilin-type N-terminal cleavage/methylation domain-containing protein